jgi:hypothetical protein
MTKIDKRRAKASPQSRGRSQAKPEQELAEPRKAESPFTKYQGIGNPGILSGRKGIAKWMKELRGR